MPFSRLIPLGACCFLVLFHSLEAESKKRDAELAALNSSIFWRTFITFSLSRYEIILAGFISIIVLPLSGLLYGLERMILGDNNLPLR